MAKGKKGSSKPSQKETTPTKDQKGKNDKSSGKNAKPDPKDGKNQRDSGANREKFLANRQAVTSFTNWTGKLPATLLHEHCQKQKWEKVQYDMKKLGGKGFIGSATLAWKNPQDNQLVTINYRLPHVNLDDPKANIINPVETTMEARHLIATFVLHRICFEKNLHLMLPPDHKRIWSDLEKERKDYLKKKPAEYRNVYNANPFVNHLQNEQDRKKKEKQREAQRQQEEKEGKQKTEIVIGTNSSAKSSKKTANALSNPAGQGKPNGNVKAVTKSLENLKVSTYRFPRKAWEQAPLIDIDNDTRQLIEDAVKHHIDWTDTPIGSSVSAAEQADIEAVLEKFKFRKSHIEEALLYTNNLTQALEWLIFHLPEDDLPEFFAKQRKDSKVSIKIASNLKFENILHELENSGYEKSSIFKKCRDTSKDLSLNAVTNNLTFDLLTEDYKSKLSQVVDAHKDSSVNNPGADLEEWQGEILGLQLIYPQKISVLSEDFKVVKIKLEPVKLSGSDDLISLKIYFNDLYPFSLVGLQLCIKDEYKLANYVKVAILKRLAMHIVDDCIGDSYVYSIIDFLEENFHKIYENPGPLFDASIKLQKQKQALEAERKNATKKSQSTKSKSRSNARKVDVNEVKKSYESRTSNPKYQRLISARKKLPAFGKKEQIVNIINQNKVTLVTGETGSGKSTQVVQFILDYLNTVESDFGSQIIVTQPRRISALGLADRLSEERLDVTGNETGYIIRGENKTSKTTRITFATTGILLRIIQGLLSSGDLSYFENLRYIFIDEVHERSVESDFLLTILKSIMNKFPNLKVVLMSATINIHVFTKFFGKIGNFHIEGRTFPIKDFYLDSVLEETNFTIFKKNSKLLYGGDDDEDVDVDLEDVGDESGISEPGSRVKKSNMITPNADSPFFERGNINYELVSSLCLKIHENLANEKKNGSILVFLPGIAEINKCMSQLEAAFRGRGVRSLILPLHSALLPLDQKRVFQVPSAGTRKIVVSTNIAETSITIPDAVAVVDSGRVKSTIYDHKLKVSKLVESWCSRAESKQRRGRAGRVQEGICYKLFTRATEHERMIDQPVPEILRVSLENVYLVIKSMGVNNVEKFLQLGIDSPNETSVEKSRQLLVQVGALNNTDNLMTDLGRYLALLPTDLHSGKLLILGTIFGNLENVLTIAAVNNSGSPFLAGTDHRDAIKEVLEGSSSKGEGDVIAVMNLINTYLRLRGPGARTLFIKAKRLSFLRMKDIVSSRRQYLQILKDVGFVPVGYTGAESRMTCSRIRQLNEHQGNTRLLRSIIASAFYPRIARVQHPDPKFFRSESGAVQIDPDAKQTKLWVRNEAFQNDNSGDCGAGAGGGGGGDSSDNVKELPATRAFLHPLSLFFNGDRLRGDFAVYTGSHQSSKLFVQGITPVLALAVVLFGGVIGYEISGTGRVSPGLVVDGWLPVRTWCKNGVLLQRLRQMLDRALALQLETTSGDVPMASEVFLMIAAIV